MSRVVGVSFLNRLKNHSFECGTPSEHGTHSFRPCVMCLEEYVCVCLWRIRVILMKREPSRLHRVNGGVTIVATSQHMR